MTFLLMIVIIVVKLFLLSQIDKDCGILCALTWVILAIASDYAVAKIIVG